MKNKIEYTTDEGAMDIWLLQSRLNFPDKSLDPGEQEDFNGSIGELLMFEKDLTPTQVTDIITKLKSDWGIGE